MEGNGLTPHFIISSMYRMHAGRRLENDTIIGDLIERACDASKLKLLLLTGRL
jgi:hypothetical protein